MPVLRSEREVSTAALPGVRKTAAKTALSTGAGVEQAKAGAAEAMAHAGETVARIGVRQFHEIEQQERDKADQIAAIAFDNAFSKFDNDRLYNPETGALAQQGKNALGLPEAVSADFEKVAGEIEKTAGNERQRLMFQRIKAQRGQAMDLTVRRHVFQEMQAYGREELTAKLENAHNAAIIKSQDPAAVAMEMSEAIFAIKEVGPKLGLGQAAIAKQVGTFQSKTLDGVITKLIAEGYDQKAKVYFEEHKSQITDGDILVRLEAKVKASTTDANGERAAAAIWEQLGPTSDSEAISIDKMETAARAKWGDDTASLKATIEALRSRKQGVADGRRERENTMNSTIWGAVFEGRSMQQIKRMPEFINAPGEVRTRVGDYFENEAARQESRASARESRAAARENRLVQQEFREERTREMKGWATVLDLKADPSKLRDTSPAEILKRLPELGHANVNRLLEDREKLVKDESAFRAAVIDRDLFNEIMQGAGVPGVYTPPSERTDTQKADLGKLLDTIESAIGAKQVAAGRRLTREETEKVARETVDHRVMVKDGWFSNDVRYPALVRIDDVPADAQARIKENLAKKGLPNPTAQDIVDNYVLVLPRVKK